MTRAAAVKGQFTIIGTSKCWGQIIKYFDKLSKTSQKGSLELQKFENCTTVACTESIETTRWKHKA